jgi:hypothetical protein
MCSAVASFQFFEGIGLGTTLAEASEQLGLRRVVSLILMFASSFSVGMVLGTKKINIWTKFYF